MQVKSKSGRLFKLPTLAEDAAINAGIAKDPDTYEVSSAEIALMRRPGRPLGSGSKVQITLRIDEDVVAKFKASGDGWQTRINDALKSWVQSHA